MSKTGVGSTPVTIAGSLYSGNIRFLRPGFQTTICPFANDLGESSRSANSLSFVAIACWGVPTPLVATSPIVGLRISHSPSIKPLKLPRRKGSGTRFVALLKATSAFQRNHLARTGRLVEAFAPLDAASFLIQNDSFVKKNKPTKRVVYRGMVSERVALFTRFRSNLASHQFND